MEHGVRRTSCGRSPVVCRRSPSHAFEFLYDRRRRIFSIGYRLADAEGPGRSTAPSTICWRRKRGWRASSPSPRVTSRSTTGFTSDALVPTGRPRDADVLGRHDVRVLDAAAPDGTSREPAGPELPRGSDARSIWPPTRRAVGDLGVGVCVYRSRRQLSVPGVRRAGLGLKRGLAADLVIAPYATALASLVTPRFAAENFTRLVRPGP